MVAARGALSEEGRRRLSQLEAVFDLRFEKPAREETVHA